MASIKERQAREVAPLIDKGLKPKLAIVVTQDHPAINVYMRKKKKYGNDIGINVDIHRIKQSDAPALIEKLNKDPDVHGVIVQLPLKNPDETDRLTNLLAPEKDVDALGENAKFEPATPLAILWLLEGHGIDLQGKKILLAGLGKLVGAPLFEMIKKRGLDVSASTLETNDLHDKAPNADVLITATGKAGIIKPDMVKHGAVVVDAGVAGEGGKTVGDVAPEVYERDDITITPQKGGVGPLTVCALFENVIKAATSHAPPNSNPSKA